ncbi:hypothetical protein [Microbacterium sp.]|uniref:hypothetical protein n=1 Tax=Microbacterium sp. TaxID=51671 RepID=UPI003C74C6EE
MTTRRTPVRRTFLRTPFRCAFRRRGPTTMILVAALATLAVAGCAADESGSPSPTPTPTDAQSVAQGCDAVRTSVADAVAQLQALDVSDPQSAAGAFSSVAERLGAAADGVSNVDVAEILPDLQTGFTTASGTLTAIAGGDLSQLPVLLQNTTSIQDSLTRFSALCTTP